MLGLTGNDTDHAEIRELLKKATAQANEKNYDSAIASLLRAYELMKTCSTEWGIKTYFRVARYHHLAGRYEEALQWLLQLHDNVDADADARELLYKVWGWRQKGGFAKISKTLRSTSKRLIKEEIELLKTRQQKIETRKQKA
jgi:tetratricopeptide (TPR) repeat protein